jgi:methyl-branched lipid omega-hydroxylase
MATARALDDIDLSDLDWWTGDIRNREAAFAALRAERPVAPMVLPGMPEFGFPETPYFSITRHADIVEASRHAELFCSGQGTNIADLPPEFVEFFGSMINMDDPRHARMRRIVSRGFTPRQLGLMKADVEGVAAEIVDEIAERGEGDFVTEVATLLPLRIILDMMGIPRSMEQFVVERTNVILGFTDPEYVDDINDTMAVTTAILTAGAELAQLVQELGEARQRDPRNDLVTALVTNEVEGEQLSPQELASFFVLLVVAGN